ncbi:MAG: lipocalin family protein [Spirosomaceae bacterium]|jgi:hypothetical protein|nr:lipocalin family protein [Spirosomataceae bacterium]
MKKLVYLFVIGLFSISCKDKEAAPSKTELLTKAKWAWTAGTVSPAYDFFGDGKPISGDYRSKYPSCYQDDIHIFDAAGKYTADEGATKCDPSDPQIYSQGTWKWDVNETVIVITEDGAIRKWKVNELTETTLKVTEEAAEGGKTYTFQYTFSR